MSLIFHRSDFFISLNSKVSQQYWIELFRTELDLTVINASVAVIPLEQRPEKNSGLICQTQIGNGVNRLDPNTTRNTPASDRKK